MQVQGLVDVTVSNVRKLATLNRKMNSCYQIFRSRSSFDALGAVSGAQLWQVSQLRGYLRERGREKSDQGRLGLSCRGGVAPRGVLLSASSDNFSGAHS